MRTLSKLTIAGLLLTGAALAQGPFGPLTANTPPAFLVSTSADVIAPCENSLSYFSAMRAAGIPGELHIYERGAHGAGLATGDPSEGTWPGLLKQWLAERGLISGGANPS